MECPKCQHENPEDAKFCMECAHPLKPSAKPLTPSVDLTQPHSYTPKFLADKILTTRSAMEGERKRVTVLFADVAGFTSMSEKLDPEQVHQIMDGCFKILMDEIHNHQGTVNQFTGDGVMALFGAPVAIENHARNACQAALSIQSAIKDYSEALKTRYGFEFKLRIGLNSGPVIVGSIGDDLRMDYTAIGDTTNLAARMENMANPGSVLVSPNTYKQVAQQFEFTPKGKTEVKGKEDALDVYVLIKEKIDRPRLGLERQIFSEMVGRDKELNQLELQINKTIAGEGSVVNVIGEAGIGKSRLIAELRNSTSMKRVALLEGRAISIGRNLSFYPIINLLKHWARLKEEDTSATALSKLETAVRNICQEDADEIFPFVAILMGMKLSGRHAERVKGIEGEGLEKLIIKNMRDLLIRSTELTPLVIVIEDLHWADASSIDMLESLFRLADTRQIVFINVFRPNYPETSDKIIKTLKENLSVYYVEIRLKPLTEEMSETLIHNMLNIKGLPHAIIDQIIERSGGNPFFIEEVVRSFIDEGAVVRTNGEFKVTEKMTNMVIPYTINDVLMARIDRLDEKTRDLVKVASVIGRSFFYRILMEVAKTVDGIDSRLSYLKEIELIRERQRMEELEYLFKHALAQEATYESILQQKRKDMHLQVAQSIEKVFDERLHEFYGMLALHYVKAENYEKAEQYLIKAGEEALRSSASSEALNYYQEGLKLYLQANQDTADPEKLAMFEKNIAIALYNKCRWEEAIAHIDKVLTYWKIPARPNRLIALVGFIKNYIFLSTGLDRVFKRTKPISDQIENERLDLLFRKGHSFLYVDNLQFFFVLLDNFNRAVKFDVSKSVEAFIAFTTVPIGLLFGGVALSWAQKLLSISEKHLDKKNTQNYMAFTMGISVLNYTAGRWRENILFEESLINESLQKGILWSSTGYMLYFSGIKFYRGEFSECEIYMSKLFDIGDTYDYDAATLYAHYIKAFAALSKGCISVVQSAADEGITFCIKHGFKLHQIAITSSKAEAQILSGDLESAKASLLQAKELFDQQKLLATTFAVPYFAARFMLDICLLRRSMDTDHKYTPSMQKDAIQNKKAVLSILKRYPPFQTKVYRLMGEYNWLIGKQKKALKWWDKSIKTGEAMGAWPDLSRTYFEVGKRLLEPDSKYKELNGITAEEYLDKARTMFVEMKLQWDLDELDKLMAAREGII